MAKQLEYTRAVRSAKIDRMFAKPFVGAMSGHHDTVFRMAADPSSLSSLVSGGFDGEVIHWNVLERKPRRFINAHRNAVDGCTFTPDGVAFLTASRDRTVKLWDSDSGRTISDGREATEVLPLTEYLGDAPFADIDHHRTEQQFVTCGQQLELWDINRSRPIQNFQWGDDSILACRFNKVETPLVACCMGDRGVCVYDSRTKAAHSKVIMALSCTSLSWNPMDPNMFVCGSDDWNCYLFDLRVAGKPRHVFQGHIHPVSSVDFAPTGRSFVAGSQDCTLRIWNVNQTSKTTSAEMYHTKRMAKVSSVIWSLDNDFIFSGSEDAIVRVWKADASKPLRPFRGPEEQQFNYMRTLRDRYAPYEEVRRIVNQRNTPKAIRGTMLRKKRIVTRDMVKEMSRKKSDVLPSLAKTKTVQSLH